MTSRIDPDTRAVVVLTVALVATLGAVSFAVSFAGLVAVAEWAELPRWLRWAVPVFVDGALLAYTLAILVQRARGESTRFSWAALGTFTLVSVGANAAHVLGTGDVADWRTLVGAGLAALAPLGVLAATHTVADLAIARPGVVQVRDEPGQVVDQVAEARRLREVEGLSHRAIAAALGVSKSTVARWVGQGGAVEVA
ncbi:DUF2637 domain-containing protein [Cellulomonas shaoxiangyii]|uniref:DUF2637 domain-containing protein n=2 Tax=Cellulomonas shaoxiangyii TaxID=2566013 RepID=A0A4P7SGZ3_9CELL|nr:DUF2637 domain-containing protein [Cellulomonas shaoxiangyii]QCB93282.1 DUF2637 domain-containing protein [Cellulomonas shaoxiangyii]